MMHGYNEGWNLYWMALMVLVLVVLIALAVYAAVRLGNRDWRQR